MAPSRRDKEAELQEAAAAIDSGAKNELVDGITTKGRWITRSISPFLSLSCVLYAGMPSDELPGEDDVILFNKVTALHPKFRALLDLIVKNEDAMNSFIADLEFYGNEARSQDINTVRYAISETLPLDPVKDVIIPPIIGSKKSIRGWNHDATAAALCPLRLRAEFDEDPLRFRSKVLNGTIKIRARDFPSFLYPAGAKYDAENIDHGLFRGHFFIRVFRMIYTGKSSALDGKRVAASASQAEMHSMKKATGETIAYAAMQAYFALSDLERWTDIANDSFEYERFFTNCTKLFTEDPNDPWVTETVNFVTSETPSLTRKRKFKLHREHSLGSDDGNDATNLILQQRARRRAATAEPGPSLSRATTPVIENRWSPSLTPPPSSPPPSSRPSSPQQLPPVTRNLPTLSNMAIQPTATASRSVPIAQNARAPPSGTLSQPQPLQPITHMSNNRQATPGNDGGRLSDAGDTSSSKKRRTAGVRARGRRGRGGAR